MCNLCEVISIVIADHRRGKDQAPAPAQVQLSRRGSYAGADLLPWSECRPLSTAWGKLKGFFYKCARTGDNIFTLSNTAWGAFNLCQRFPVSSFLSFRLISWQWSGFATRSQLMRRKRNQVVTRIVRQRHRRAKISTHPTPANYFSFSLQ